MGKGQGAIGLPPSVVPLTEMSAPAVMSTLSQAERLELARLHLNNSITSEAMGTVLQSICSAASTTSEEVKRVALDFLGSATADSQKVRLQLLKNSVVVFVCAGYPRKRFIYEKAKELGVRCILIDSPNHWGKDCVPNVFDQFHGVDLSRGHEQVFEDVLRIINSVKQEFGVINGVCSFSDLAQPLVARACEVLGYPGNSTESVRNARNKELTRKALEVAGLPTPAHMLIENADQLEDAAQKVGFPAVLKPIAGSESIGVVRVDNKEDLISSYNNIQKQLSHTIYKDGCLRTNVADEDLQGAANEALDFDVHIMMEQYLDGPEVDVDIVMHKGEIKYANVVDNWPTFEPFFQETGTNVPSVMSPSQQQELIQAAGDSLRALGLTHGVQHVELKYTSRGPRLIEINCRMGGKCVRLENLLSTGVDLVEEHLMAAVGLPCAPPMLAQPLHYIAEYSVNAPRSGVLVDHKFLEKWQQHPDVIYCRPLAEIGSVLVGQKDGFPSWVCEVMVEKPNIQEAIAFVKHVMSTMCEEMNIQPAKET